MWQNILEDKAGARDAIFLRRRSGGRTRSGGIGRRTSRATIGVGKAGKGVAAPAPSPAARIPGMALARAEKGVAPARQATVVARPGSIRR